MPNEQRHERSQVQLDRLVEVSFQLLGAIRNEDWPLAEVLVQKRHLMALVLSADDLPDDAVSEASVRAYQTIEDRIRREISEKTATPLKDTGALKKIRKYQAKDL